MTFIYKSVGDYMRETHGMMAGRGIARPYDERMDNQALQNIERGIIQLNNTVAKKKEPQIIFHNSGVEVLARMGESMTQYVKNIKY